MQSNFLQNIMRLSIKEVLVPVFFIYSLSSSYSNNLPVVDYSWKLVELPSPIVFKKNSTEYAKTSEEKKLDLFFSNYASLNNYDVKILLSYQSCNQEIHQDKLIGYKRAEKILLYGIKKWGIKRRSVFVRDVSSDYFNSGTCEGGGVFISVMY